MRSLVDEIVWNCLRFSVDESSSFYGTKIYSGYANGLFLTYRPIVFRGTDSIMFHTLEADEPGSGAWKRFWAEFLFHRPRITQTFTYAVIDSIMNERFERHIAESWGLVLAGELRDPSTAFGTYCFNLRALNGGVR